MGAVCAHTMLLFLKHSLKAESVFPGVLFPGPDSVCFLIYFKYNLTGVFHPLLPKGGRSVFLPNISLSVFDLSSIKWNSDL